MDAAIKAAVERAGVAPELVTEVLFGNCLAAGFAFAIVYQETRREECALLGASLYMLTPFRMGEVTLRGDLAEHLALGFLPAALFGYRRILAQPRPSGAAS